MEREQFDLQRLKVLKTSLYAVRDDGSSNRLRSSLLLLIYIFILQNDDEQQNDSCPPYLRAPRTMQRVFASEPSEHQVRKLHICLGERAEISMILWISGSAAGRRNRIFGC